MQCVAVCCSVWLCVAAVEPRVLNIPVQAATNWTRTRGSVLQCVLVRCSVLQCTVVCCNDCASSFECTSPSSDELEADALQFHIETIDQPARSKISIHATRRMFCSVCRHCQSPGRFITKCLPNTLNDAINNIKCTLSEWSRRKKDTRTNHRDTFWRAIRVSPKVQIQVMNLYNESALLLRGGKEIVFV